MSPTAAASPQQETVALRHRRNITAMQPDQLAGFRQAITLAQGISDERGYQYWAGVHGLPLPSYCQHHSPLFLPWHRAYLYFFERTLQDLVAGVTLPWWDWSAGSPQGIPPAYAAEQVDGQPNPLYSSPIQPQGREPGGPDHTVRSPGDPQMPPLPDAPTVQKLLGVSQFADFQEQLENIHNGVHMWVGGTMGDIATAAYDPLFWAHHTMIDRLWRLWQLAHPGAMPAASLLEQALPPFPMTVTQTLDSDTLGYDYAVATAAAPGPGSSGG
jgi:tyrosinase